MPGGIVSGVTAVGTGSDSGSGITCILQRRTQQMDQHFGAEQLVYPCVTGIYFTLVDRQKVLVKK